MMDGLTSGDALFGTFDNFEFFPIVSDRSWIHVVEFCLYGCPDIAIDVPADPPTAPTNLRTNSTPNAITLNWDDNSNCETGYSIERAQVGGVFSEIARIAADSTSYTDTYNLSGNTVYKYYVRGVNGSVYSQYSPLCYGETGPCDSGFDRCELLPGNKL
ncbi:MAG: fibronectin type III domain-containing protein [Spirochaetales bacterium]|nr:fibronectin type III domain-containing protein [Spirochaetales bacterium]